MTQVSSRGGINLQYAPISILPESIPVWGVCHRRLGKRVILMDRYVYFTFFRKQTVRNGEWRNHNVTIVVTGLAALIASAALNWHYGRSTLSRSTRKDWINATRRKRRPWPLVRRTRVSPRANREKLCFTVSLPLFFLAPLLPSLEKLPPFADSFPVRSSSNAFLPYRNQRIERRSSRRPRVLPNQWPVCFHLFRQWRIDRSRQHWWKCQRMSRTRFWIIKLSVRLRIGAPLQTLLFRRSRYN